MRSPIIGIPLEREQQYDERPRLVVNRAYIDAVERSGGVPLPIPVSGEAAQRALFERCDGLLLPGGADIDPRHYGEDVRADCSVRWDEEVDISHLRLGRWALDEDLPLLAICRGMELVNVLRGGTLWQDLTVQGATQAQHTGLDRVAIAHDIEVAPGTGLDRIAGARRLATNSLHHQAVRRLGEGLVASAWSPDGIVEALEDPDARFCIGIQSHPEELIEAQPWPAAVFAAFVAAAAGSEWPVG